ncbi:1-deoxy-D-xylulose-5-phosphate synthase [uncultured Corynebacterium sp.]|uniref:1-deoxy-D-xylulose-5-phosphate synthase n=1 Tax=uncultured Corynebacterium sp. TaxID=159447 RepID=UPI0025D92FB5|nr:1-deoxy-D-xylulose-5-phosphate synthase [uncultured Corynebacterium sp.]
MTDLPILGTVSSPADLRSLDGPTLVRLAAEIRSFLVKKVSVTGGHLGPNLGVVELTLAIHRVFNSPSDPVIFDTGHQAYVHKIVTGRWGLFDTLRHSDGLSGYPARDESPHDWTESSHGSASLSYADGLAKAFALTGQTDRRVVALIGDGALTGGMAWEALESIADGSDRPVVIVVNDNGRSYAPTVGGLARTLADLRDRAVTGRRGAGPAAADRRLIRRLRRHPTGDVPPRTLFGDLGLAYLGPVDGHDLPALESVLRRARDLGGPVIVHAVTEKGHGYAPALADDTDRMHCIDGVGARTGTAPDGRGEQRRHWVDVFAGDLVRLGDLREDIVAVTAAMPGPTGLTGFAERHPDRVFDVGIAEQHAVTSAAGLALGGLRPVVAVYSTFLNRAFDQLLMDIGLLRLPVTFVLDRAGITGPDGPSHNGMWDLSITAVVPGIRIAAPRDGIRLTGALERCLAVSDGPTVLRFPKGELPPAVPALRGTVDYDVLAEPEEDPVDTPLILVVNYGAMTGPSFAVTEALIAAGCAVVLIDPVWVSPPAASVVDLADAADLVITVEDNGVHGGAGQQLHRAMVSAEVDTPVRYLAEDQTFPAHGTRAEVMAGYGLDEASAARRALAWAGHLFGQRGK